MDLWNVHLNPGTEDTRLAEVKLLAAMIDIVRPAIVMGDLNSLSHADNYPDELMKTLVLQGIEKFGTTELRYDVTDYFASQGFIDLAAARHQLQTTVPTDANKDKQHAARMRLDYMLATPSAAALVAGIYVPKNDLTNVISDHYPVVLTLNG